MWASGISFTKSSPHICFFFSAHYSLMCLLHIWVRLCLHYFCLEWKKKEKHAKLILLVTLVLIHNHNLFLMKRWLLCGWQINNALREMLTRFTVVPLRSKWCTVDSVLDHERERERRGEKILFFQLTCWPVTNRMEPSLACTTCRKTWSRMRSSLQQFCSSFIWSSTCLMKGNKHVSFWAFSFI